MFSFNIFKKQHRAYAQRMASGQARRAMLSIRVHEGARKAVKTIATQRGMSISEYMARLLNDHLAHLMRSHFAIHPGIEGGSQ